MQLNAEKIHLWDLFGVARWVVNSNWLAVIAILIGLSPLAMWLNHLLFTKVEFMPLSHQWLSALFDPLLAVGVGVMVWQLGRINASDIPLGLRQILERKTVHIAVVALWFVFSAWHVYNERKDVTTWSRRLGPNSIYHNGFLVPFFGYLYTVLLVVSVVIAVSTWRLQSIGVLLVALATALAWFWAGNWYDANHRLAPDGKSKHVYTSPQDPWQDGLIPRLIRGF